MVSETLVYHAGYMLDPDAYRSGFFSFQSNGVRSGGSGSPNSCSI